MNKSPSLFQCVYLIASLNSSQMTPFDYNEIMKVLIELISVKKNYILQYYFIYHIFLTLKKFGV